MDAEVKAGLLELIDHAVAGGWSMARACRVLQLHPDRAGRWRRGHEDGGGLDDATPGPAEPLHALLDWERDAIVALFDEWAEVDRSHRKLAHRGSRLEKVFVSESSVLRVLQAENLVLPERPPREPVPARPWPAWVEYRPCQVATRLQRSRTIPRVDERPRRSIVCFVVRAGHRRQGVAGALLDGAIVYATSCGVELLEACRVDNDGERMSSVVAYVGTTTMFERAGFHRVQPTSSRTGGRPRWVMRLAP